MRSLMEGVEALWWLWCVCVCERGADLNDPESCSQMDRCAGVVAWQSRHEDVR